MTILSLLLAPTWTMVLGGDLMLNGIPPERDPLGSVAALFRGADYAYANLEIPITGASTRTSRKTAADLRARNQYILKASPRHIKGIAGCGFDALSLGNNHAMDYGPKGLGEMTKLLQSKGIGFTGAGSNEAEAATPTVAEAGGQRIAMLSFLAFQSEGGRSKCWPASRSSAGVATITLDRVKIGAHVANARRGADMVVVALHWGLEKHTVPTPYQVSLGRAFVDAGADVVVGAHPHVLQGAEMYKGKPILYSLGNFVAPRPGSTGFIEFTYSGREIKRMRFVPAAISGGVVRLTKTGPNFAALCEAVSKRFPNPRSRTPKVAR